MTVTFLHTADWQLGKGFATVEDPQKRAALQQERLNVLQRIAAAAKAHAAAFVVVAGDLFDSTSATKATVSAACSAIGEMRLPVYVIPGNHDHGGPGSLWEQPFFQRERTQLAPNLEILTAAAPVERPDAVLFPCPLLRRHDAADTTAWLRGAPAWNDRFSVVPRIVIAHGSVQDFGEQSDEEDSTDETVNRIDVARLSGNDYDYIALGDWHGTKQVAPQAWYAGTPELDRFPKGEAQLPGGVLVITATRGEPPQVKRVHTARFRWHTLTHHLTDDASLAELERRLESLVGNRAGEDLLRLDIGGVLGIEATTRLAQFIESCRARLLRLALVNRATVAPSPEELQALVARSSDPLIARVAAVLAARSAGRDEDAAVARVALQELYAACH